jgi:PAS domain S-box-containing protein
MRATAGAWALSLAAIVAAVLLRWLLDPVLGNALPFVTLFGAVAAAVWAGGVGAAAAVTVIGYGAVSYLFIAPRGELGFHGYEDVVGLLAYLFTCGIIIGLGETMRAQRARAAEQRELLRVTLRSIGDAVLTTDVDGHVTYLNAVAESLTGWTQDDARGQQLDAVFHIVNETTRRPVENPSVRALRDGAVVGLANHTLLVRRDGSECPIDDSAAPIRDEQGRVSGCVLIFRDVTEQRQSERNKADQLLTARMLAAIVESSEVAIVGKSLDGIIRSWNTAAERLFGHPASHAIGRHITLVIPPERTAEEDHIITRLKAGQTIEHFETERLRADGERVHVSLTISPIRDDDGNVIGASKIVRDITREKQLEENLRKVAADLALADRRKDEFLATLSHELRGPLSPLLSVLEIWKRSTETEALDRARTTMERQLGQLVRLVDDLLDLNRITHDRLALRRGRVELGAVIRQAVEALQPLADSLRHEIRVVPAAEPIWLNADGARLAQVFGNLISNACRYTNEGGLITVATELQGGSAVVTVTDTGTGIPADKIDRIFDMFTQLDRSTDSAQGGLGIGLTLVKRLVQMHGGSVDAKSEGLGRGSELLVRLPVLDGTASALPVVTRPAHAPAQPRRRILVVDDNEDSANSLAQLLEIEGHETLTSHDGAAALAVADAHRPDVVLLDIGLPTMDGHEVCRAIRSRHWGEATVLIAITGWGQEHDRRESQLAGFDGHLVKPVDYGTLRELLRSLAAKG